jgi:hypothetical protein
MTRFLLIFALAGSLWGQSVTTATGSGHVTGVAQSGGKVVFNPCGPPTYSCALNNLAVGGKNIIQLPSTPNMGNVTGTGTVVTPTDFNNPICRLTDENFDPSLQNVNFIVDAGTSGDETLSNTNGSLWVLGTTGGRAYPVSISFVGNTCTITRLYASNPSWTSTGGWYLTNDDPGWSYTNPNLLFEMDATNPEIDSYNVSGFTPTGTPPSNVPVFDFRSGQSGSWGTTSANCLPSGYTMNWSSYGKQNKFSNGGADQVFTAGLSNSFEMHGSVASGTFTLNELVTQTGTGATVLFVDIDSSNGALVGRNLTGSANNSGTWTGGSSGATFSPASLPLAGGQGTGVDVVFYEVGVGCMYLNMETGAITADQAFSGGTGLTCTGTGCTGTVCEVFSGTCTTPFNDRFTLHNVKISKDGNWALIAGEICLSTSCNFTTSSTPVVWQLGTTNVFPLCVSPNGCSGHWTEGTLNFVNNDGSPNHYQEVIRLYGNNNTFTNIPMGLPWPAGNCTLNMDQHPGWSNTNATDSLPFFTSTYDGSAPTGWNPFTCVLEDEIIGIHPTLGTVWRFAHTFNTDQSPILAVSIAVGSVSQDGRFYIFTSDWMGTLGGFNTAGGGSLLRTTACTINAAINANYCIGDVFVVQLR